ncbi:MAG: hypothetical protein Q4B94_00175 [Pseudomonadota bacterium]|nr:hypothetical protein [Pseudomonadota bacterium]
MYNPFTPCAATAALNTAKLFSTIRPDSTGRFWETVHHKQNGTEAVESGLTYYSARIWLLQKQVHLALVFMGYSVSAANEAIKNLDSKKTALENLKAIIKG